MDSDQYVEPQHDRHHQWGLGQVISEFTDNWGDNSQDYEQLWDDIKGFIASELGKLSNLIDGFREQLEDLEAKVELLDNKISESTTSSSDVTPQSARKRKRKSDLKMQATWYFLVMKCWLYLCCTEQD